MKSALIEELMSLMESFCGWTLLFAAYVLWPTNWATNYRQVFYDDVERFNSENRGTRHEGD